MHAYTPVLVAAHACHAFSKTQRGHGDRVGHDGHLHLRTQDDPQAAHQILHQGALGTMLKQLEPRLHAQPGDLALVLGWQNVGIVQITHVGRPRGLKLDARLRLDSHIEGMLHLADLTHQIRQRHQALRSTPPCGHHMLVGWTSLEGLEHLGQRKIVEG